MLWLRLINCVINSLRSGWMRRLSSQKKHGRGSRQGLSQLRIFGCRASTLSLAEHKPNRILSKPRERHVHWVHQQRQSKSEPGRLVPTKSSSPASPLINKAKLGAQFFIEHPLPPLEKPFEIASGRAEIPRQAGFETMHRASKPSSRTDSNA